MLRWKNHLTSICKQLKMIHHYQQVQEIHHYKQVAVLQIGWYYIIVKHTNRQHDFQVCLGPVTFVNGNFKIGSRYPPQPLRSRL